MNNRIQLFSEEPGFLKLFQLFRDKYRSIGRVGGNVSLKTFNQDEAEAIAGFLGQSSERLLQKGSVSLLDFENELSNTGFSDYTLLQLLEEVLREPIFTKKEESELEKKREEEFFNTLKLLMPKAEWWLTWIQSKTPDTRFIWSLYKQNKVELKEKLITVFKAFSSVLKNEDFERLPFFSQRTTGNPHYFDMNEVACRLLLHCMNIDQLIKGNASEVMLKSVEDINYLLAEYGIVRDDLWNFVTCRGLLASTQDSIHSVWQAAIDTQAVMNIPLKELGKVDRIWPAQGKRAWILENSSVCSTIMDEVPQAAIICTHGQLRIASWKLLDLLVESDCTLYYSGDIDPEGLVIADRLKKRYKEKVVFWRMDKEAYDLSLSKEDVSSRLSKLDSLTSPEWIELTNHIRDKKVAGYQEAIVSNLINDIREYMVKS